jgi:Fe-coproporphyrin III synthase
MSNALTTTLSREQSGVLHLHLLDRCNLRCDHCYIDAAGDGYRSLPLNLVLRCLDETGSLGIRTVFLSGGEPFLYPDFGAVLAELPRHQFHAAVCTNGTRIGPAEATAVKAAGAGAQVSIDGDEPYHDAFRGVQGAFRAAARGIRELVAAGVSVSVVTTICRDNLAMLPWIANWAAANGVSRISVQPLQQVGRGAAIADRLLTEDQMCTLYLTLSDLACARRTNGLAFSLAYRAREYLVEHPCAAYVCNGERCHRRVAKEIKTLVIREDGTVLPEIPTLDPRFALGNLREAPLPDLVARYFREGYGAFQELCRIAFYEVVPGFHSPIVPWDEILSARSWTFQPRRHPDLCQLAGCP